MKGGRVCRSGALHKPDSVKAYALCFTSGEMQKAHTENGQDRLKITGVGRNPLGGEKNKENDRENIVETGNSPCLQKRLALITPEQPLCLFTTDENTISPQSSTRNKSCYCIKGILLPTNIPIHTVSFSSL